jgi:hypothetical protein
VVLNGGDGAWKQPQQAILLLLYCDVIDAVVTLDGFNEYYAMIGADQRMERPPTNFMDVNPVVQHGAETMMASWANGRIFNFTMSNPIADRSKAFYFLSKTMRDFIRTRYESSGRNDQTFFNMFALPGDWTPSQFNHYNIESYKKYVRLMNAVAQKMHLKIAHFIQPCPAIGKKLTPEEQRTAGDLAYGKTYQMVTDQLSLLNSEGIGVFSLLDVFNDVQHSLYADHIHCIRDPGTDCSEGYRIMAERIVEILWNEWKLREIPSDYSAK